VYDCGFTDITTISVNGKCTGDRESIPLLVISCFFIFLIVLSSGILFESLSKPFPSPWTGTTRRADTAYLFGLPEFTPDF
jgi:hypothetical protein